MKAGIIANTGKEKIADAVLAVAKALIREDFECCISDSMTPLVSQDMVREYCFSDDKTMVESADIIISLGGDGTLLSTASKTLQSGKPIVGINFGKLGFLTEIHKETLHEAIKEIKAGNYFIEERIVLEGKSEQIGDCDIFAINDIVIEKGGWPKMMEISLFANGELVSGFSADGLIIATPTGSTGYSMSAGGPIVNPRADVVVISPICPHSLTMRPIVLPADMTIRVEVSSHPVKFSINCDGQRVNQLTSPFAIEIVKGNHPLRLVRTKDSSYFNVLRNKLYWGLDVRGRG